MGLVSYNYISLTDVRELTLGKINICLWFEILLINSLVLNLGLLRSFGLQLPEAFSTNCAGWGFWELQFKNIRVTKVKNH